MIYLDNAATTQVHPVVMDAMMPYLQEQYGNPGTLYSLGRTAKEAIENARHQVAEFIGADPRQIIFTSSGTEANNMVFFSMSEHLKNIGKTHIVTSAVEHDSVLKAVREMNIKHEFDYTIIGVDERGCVNPKDVYSAINEQTGIVSVMYINNETGSVNDIYEIAEICREKGVYFHTDCVQAASSCKLNVGEIGCHFLSISAHKIHGVKGAGALYAQLEVLSPMICGGVSQEFGIRGGTENVASIVAFGKACEIMREEVHDVDVHTSVLKQVFYTQLKQNLAKHSLDNVVHVNGDVIVKQGKILNVRFDNVDGETLLLLLDSKGVCVSAGSACRSHMSEPSHVLLAMGVDPNEARNSIRVSFSKMNSVAEVKEAACIIADCVRQLRA